MSIKELRDDIYDAVENAKNRKLISSEILDTLNEVAVELWGEARLYEHHQGDVPPRLTPRQPSG